VGICRIIFNLNIRIYVYCILLSGD
jgi:hypothetical protein